MRKELISKRAIMLISFLVLAWWVISFFDIISHNTFIDESYGKYFDWNFFIILKNFVEGVKR